MARTGLRMMPTSPSSPLKFRTAGFPQYGLKVGFRWSLPDDAWPTRRTVGTHRSFTPWPQGSLAQSRGPRLGGAPPFERLSRSTPGALAPVRVMLSRSITAYRPHPSHSSAREDFTALRLIPRAFAVPSGLGDRRVVPCFRCRFLPGMPPSTTPGSSSETFAQPISMTLAFAPLARARRSQYSPSSVSDGASFFRGFTGSLLLRPVRLLASLTDPTGVSPSRRDVYTRASDGSVTLPAAEYSYGGIWAFSTGGTFTRWNRS